MLRRLATREATCIQSLLCVYYLLVMGNFQIDQISVGPILHVSLRSKTDIGKIPTGVDGVFLIDFSVFSQNRAIS